MEIVGDKFQSCEYWLAQLVMASEIFKEAMALVTPQIIATRKEDSSKKIRIVVGTVEGDVHDIGKNIFKVLAECAGFEVSDLGVDVAPQVFVKAVAEQAPQVVGMSGLLTASIPAMQNTIEELEKQNLRAGKKIMLGGAMVGELWVKGKTTADFTTMNANEGIKYLKQTF